MLSLCAQDYGALTERQTALIMYEALQTVAACHQARIYHGDIKPANFMLANALPEHSLSGELEKCVSRLLACMCVYRTEIYSKHCTWLWRYAIHL